MDCALFYQVSGVDGGYRQREKDLRSYLITLVLPVSFNEAKNGFQQKKQRMKMY